MPKILLTGVTGYIGKRLLRQLLSERPESFLLPLRAPTPEEFEQRKNKLLQGFDPGQHSRLEFLRADLSSLTQALTAHRESISIIIHNAAKTAFNVDETTANADNRDASVSLFRFAKTCPALKKFVYVSTLYASGMTSGPLREEFFERPEFANHYERSKWETEEVLRTQFDSLPWCIARVATVIAENEQGLVIQQNAIHNTLKLFYYGLISLLPGKAQTPIHLVDGDFVKKALAQIVGKGEPHHIYHVSYEQSGSVALGRFIDLAFEEFSQDETFRSRRLLKPLFADEKSFEALVTNMKGFGGQVLNQGLASISPFGRQLFITKEVHNEALRSLWPDYAVPSTETMVRNACRHLAQSKFAKGEN